MSPETCTSPVELFNQFDADPLTVARNLLGQRLVRIIGGQRLAGTIVEVEAYLGAKDKAAHTYGGRRTPRNESMYLPAGHLYVYFTYGMHYCMNIVCGKKDEGVAVLIRALMPTEGLELMRQRRTIAKREFDLCSGPAKLTQALEIDLQFDGIDMTTSPSLTIEQLHKSPLSWSRIARTPRIGVSYAQNWANKPLRLCLKDNPYLSRPVR